MNTPALSHSRFGPRQAQPLGDMIAGAKDVLDGLFAQPSPDDLPPMARAAMELQSDIKRIAAEKFSDEAGTLLLEALCDATLRRPVMIVVPGLSLETAALMAAKREGQNEAIYMLLQMIAGGRGEIEPHREGA